MSSSADYGPVINALIDPGRFTELGRGSPNHDALARLEGLTIDAAWASQRIADREAARCCLAGLWLYHDFLDWSHTISQSIDTIEGSYWHAIMHRREGDFANSKYWLRRVGEHPVYDELARSAASLMNRQAPGADFDFLAAGRWNPYVWVDLVEAVERGSRPERQACVAIQKAEWGLLFDHCYLQATR